LRKNVIASRCGLSICSLVGSIFVRFVFDGSGGLSSLPIV
jgi:hypothetical protein